MIGAIPAFLVLLGLGIAYIVMGNTGGRFFGAALVAVWLGIVLVVVKRRFGSS